VEIYTIGFTQTTAEHFFGRLKSVGVERLLDVRLKNDSQLAGFAKARDLPFFLRELVDADYEHEPMLAPTAEILDAFKKRKGDWADYVVSFNDLMEERGIEHALDPAAFAEKRTALLCSEATPDHCHRRLVVEYLSRHWPDTQAAHL
jgi:uncharacterized protein (DUF488 family)